MKKIRKINLELKKEMVSFLSENDLNEVKGGANTHRNQGCNTFYSNCLCMSEKPPCQEYPEQTGGKVTCNCQPISGKCDVSYNCLTTNCISTDACPPSIPCIQTSLCRRGRD